jgi:drug/metabolite transporter (DMT)-like permease
VLSRVVTVAAGIAAALIAIGILFVVLEGNQDNGLVSASTDAAKFLAGPFDELFMPKSRKLGVGVSWGIAAVVYLVVGQVVAGLLDRSSS